MEPILMSPAPGSRCVRHVGDSLRFVLSSRTSLSPDRGWSARLRTTLGRGRALREEIIGAHTQRVPRFGSSWHDVPLRWTGAAWETEILLSETGFYLAKAYLLDAGGYQHWPAGPDAGVSIHPDWCRTANTIYCAFTRLFGETRRASRVHPEPDEAVRRALEKAGTAVLPASGTFRDLARQLPHIVQRLGCRILHLLPVHPTPTTFARFGRMGSPYAALDLAAVDPSLVEFDQRTTGVEQFVELTRGAHRLGARVFLDIVINHTGWGSTLFEQHPEFFRREADGRFASPGAWGVVWEDLVELEPGEVALWDLIADSLKTWCRRGVDGFRCDAGYKVPTAVWQYVIAQVRQEFPDTVFLLEGLGGSWAATETLLNEGGMQWAYSELFQNYEGPHIQGYLDYALPKSAEVGTYVHYSETHDNERLAAKGRAWSLLRNRLCALTSVKGGFGITCGVEWLATEKIRVHERTGLAWDQEDAIVEELARLNALLAQNPVFFDGASLRRLSPPGSQVFALERISADRSEHALVLINPDPGAPRVFELDREDPAALGDWRHELLGQELPPCRKQAGCLRFELPPASAYCLALRPSPLSQRAEEYRQRRSRIAWAIQTATELVRPEDLLGPIPDRLATAVAAEPAGWLSALSDFCPHRGYSPRRPLNLGEMLSGDRTRPAFPNVIHWNRADACKVTIVPPGWWLLVESPDGFRVSLEHAEGNPRFEYATALGVDHGYVACFAPREPAQSVHARLTLEPHDANQPRKSGEILFLGVENSPVTTLDLDGLALLTNGRGGMARLRLDFGSVRSKYDCALGANLDPTLPVDRQVLAKRLRAWLNADGFLSPLDRHNLVGFRAGPPAVWTFAANAGDGRRAMIQLEAAMGDGRNTVFFRFRRLDAAAFTCSVTLRVDLEDRSFHAETHRGPGAEHHFDSHTSTLADGRIGFRFDPAADRHLEAWSDRGHYHAQPEWSEHVSHPVESSRGQVGEGDAYSPGWFEIPLPAAADCLLVLDAEPTALDPEAIAVGLRAGTDAPAGEDLGDRLAQAARAYVVRRGDGRTVIAGYPWFLDWGRDTLIAARGLLAAGWHDEVLEILAVFGAFAENGTLPNSIHGANASNRDTTDAPLWYALVTEEVARTMGESVLRQPLAKGRTLLEVVESLAVGYLTGTPNGIRVDPDSGLVWSPSHFTWMDTNHPPGTPREGYPIEIQALWIRALRFLARHRGEASQRWQALAEQAHRTVLDRFWLPEEGWLGDVLLAHPGQGAAQATLDRALRCNMLLAPALGIVEGPAAQRSVQGALRHLWVPGAVRSLAPLPANPPLPIRGADGRLLNDPDHPYWGRYAGDEDTRRKPAYHNGTAWTWFLPILAEALDAAWPGESAARRAAQAILRSLEALLPVGCVGHLPEILDGDAPHLQRGCDAQAWSVTEALRVWRKLQ